MRIFLVVVLIIHAVLETLMGGLLAFSPKLINAAASEFALQQLNTLGMLALASVAVVIFLWPNRTDKAALSVGLGALAAFHSAVIIASLISGALLQAAAGYTHHILLAVSFWVLWFQRGKLMAA
ncbi:hypothetical protein [Halioxenophilus sp. WMMB6]|uniref:hypothetical protein n=1 Tax=Halioxenophilus sp. WMMB6 TaxID=3073815 RepID=UPI00295F5967|nr:hypothetical protein [Halioxenophilus sp. WMMB6]